MNTSIPTKVTYVAGAMLAIVWVLPLSVSADYAYTSWSLCNQGVCSNLVCEVTQYDSEIIETTHSEEITLGSLQEVANYLLSAGETRLAEIVIASQCATTCAQPRTWTTTEVVTPPSTEQCAWSAPVCGNDIVESNAGEECDLWVEQNGTEWSYCDVDCKIVQEGWLYSTCGNYQVDLNAWEECDLWPDKNGAIGTTCDANCRFVTENFARSAAPAQTILDPQAPTMILPGELLDTGWWIEEYESYWKF